jgi:hypothetical protein
MFIDWNGNGKKDDLFDDMMDMDMIYQIEKEDERKKGGSSSCLILLITLPVWAPVALIMKAVGNIRI